MSEQKLYLHDTVIYLEEFDIVVLLETQLEFAPSTLLRDYTHFGVTAPEACLRGYGISVFVRDTLAAGVSIWAVDEDLDVVWLRFPGAVFGVSGPVFLAACYVPPQGSVRLQGRDVTDRFDALAGRVDSAMAHGEVFLCGDFNASFRAEHSAPTGLRSGAAHGRQLLQICEAHDLAVLATSPDGTVLEPSFQARPHTAPTRPDHVVVSRALRETVHFQGIDLSRFDSDHYPLVVHLDMTLLPVVDAHGHLPVHAIRRLIWDSEYSEDYRSHVANSSGQPAFARIVHALGQGDVGAVGQTLMTALRGLALDVAMHETCPRVSRRTGARVQPYSKPWFDEECRSLKADLRRALARHAPREELRPLRRAFNGAARRKRRAHQRRRLRHLLGELRERPKRYWDAFLPKAERLPPELRHPGAWASAMHLALNPPCSEPTGEAIMEGSPPAGDGADLLGAVTREEVVVALVGLRNYKASGFSGCPTELLKYAILNDDPSTGYQVPSDVDVPQHLATMLDACFRTGRVPAAWNKMLVSPVFKKGDKADLANYRPISVGDALAKLYAVVLNNRLLPWLESHHLRAPTQAGFRPQLGTSHPLFGLRHFIDVSARTRRPLYVCFVDLTKAYDTVPRALLWQIVADIGVPARFMTALQSIYADPLCQVRVEVCVGAEFESSLGVEQGCPLSPILFGIFIDRLCFMIEGKAADAGPWLSSGRRVPSTPDDFRLLALGRLAVSHMDRLLRVVDEFCLASGMRVNTGIGKTEMMLFGVSAARRAQLQAEVFRVGGQAIRFVSSYKYLGIHHHMSSCSGGLICL